MIGFFDSALMPFPSPSDNSVTFSQAESSTTYEGLMRATEARHIACGPVSFIPLSFQLVSVLQVATRAGRALEVTVKVIDRSSNRGEPLLLSRSVMVPDWAKDDEKQFGRFVRGCVLWMMNHELDECLHVLGERLHDPHAEVTV